MPKKKKKKKTAFCAFVLAMLMPAMVMADSVNLGLSTTAAPLGSASQGASIIYGLDNSLTYTATLRQVKVNSSGELLTSAGNSTYTVKVDAQGSSVVAFMASSYVYASSTAFQVTTAGLAVNVSHVAGAACNDCRVYWQAPASIYWDYASSSTIPGTLGATTGFTLTANVTPLLDDGFIDGQHIIFKAQASTVNIPVIVRKRQ